MLVKNNPYTPISKEQFLKDPNSLLKALAAAKVQNAVPNKNAPLNAAASEALKNQILAKPSVEKTAEVSVKQASRVAGYKNNLKTMLQGNEAKLLAVIPRTMNAQDTDGNGLIQGNEISGNFINAVERLDEIKAMGINTLHMLPIHPPGKTKAMGTAGSLYAPGDFLGIDPNLRDPNDPRSVEEQCKYFLDECHKRQISVMLDMPSCVSVDFAKQHPELMAMEKNGNEKTPQGWQDIRMFRFWDDESKRILNPYLLDLHKKYVDTLIDLGFDGIRADVARAKPVEFWNVMIPYSRAKDPEFAWLAESYTYEDASPQLNMPHDRPNDQLKAGFDSYYGQWHIFNQWNDAKTLYDYVIENIKISNKHETPKGMIGSFATHDDQSPMFNGGAPWVMLTTVLQATLPQMSPYFVDGVQSGDYYLYPYENAQNSITQTDSKLCTVHKGRIDIFNFSRKPGGNYPQIGDFITKCMELKSSKEYQDVINKGSFIPLKTDNPKVIAYLRHEKGKTLLVVANRDVNFRSSGQIEIPTLDNNQMLKNLTPTYGDKSYLQAHKDGLTVDLGPSRAHVFEINTPDIETKFKTIYKQKL